MKTEKEIIEETIEVYSDPNNRALYYKYGGPEDATCVYLATNGNRCAVGRCISKDKIKDLENVSRRISKLYQYSSEFQDALKPKYKGHSIQFWSNLQKLHDTHIYWSEDGITEKGIAFVEKHFSIKIKEPEVEWQN